MMRGMEMPPGCGPMMGLLALVAVLLLAVVLLV
jgi:hypothetical protein